MEICSLIILLLVSYIAGFLTCMTMFSPSMMYPNSIIIPEAREMGSRWSCLLTLILLVIGAAVLLILSHE